MYAAYQKFEALLYKIEKLFVIIPFFLIFVTVVEQVFQRYFNLPVADSSEISMICQAVFTFIGMGMLVYSEDHITIEVNKLIKNLKVLAFIELIMYLLLISFSILYLYLGSDLMKFALKTGTATTQLRIPLSIPYGCLLAGFGLVIIHSVGKILRLFVMRDNLEALYNKEVNIEDMR